MTRPVDVSLGRVLRIAGLLTILAPVILAGAIVIGWVAWQIAIWIYALGAGA